VDEFDHLLRGSIERTIDHIFGDTNARIIYEYLEKRGCGLEQISSKTNLFSAELRKILGTGRGQLLGVAAILEEAILEALSDEMGLSFDRLDGKSFAEHVERLKECNRKKPQVAITSGANGLVKRRR
jgi:hypothetical protein